MPDLSAFLDSTAGIALKGALVAAALDFVTGSFAALRDGTFALDVLAAFLRKHVLGRVAPLAALLVGGYVSGDALLLTFAAGGLTAYAAETISSIKGNIFPPAPSHETPTPTEAAALKVNPVPTE